MAGPREVDKTPVTVADRFDSYRIEVEKVVTRGIEHANYELKRSASISKDNLADRLDFVKLIQGLANASGAEERFVIIGADQKERKFYEVPNASEFDPATLGPILAKYLNPQPILEVFNNVCSDSGETYVLIVISPSQSRPVVALCEGTSDKRTHFREGDIWVKRDTRLQLAGRPDLDLMYEKQIDDEAENRARRRFEHLSQHLRPTIYANPVTSMPGRTLLMGDRNDLRSFAESTIAAGETVKLKMLIEMARERMVEEWSRVTPEDFVEEAEIPEVLSVHRDGFVPSLDSLVDVGLQIIKFDGSDEWLELIVSMLIEGFEASRRLDRLNSGFAGRDRREELFAHAAFEVYVGVRALATYAVMRRRFRFLKAMLPRMITIFMSDHYEQISAPLILWPFSGKLGLPDINGGLNRALWDSHINAAWTYHFGTREDFLGAASQLEFILEFNSYMLVAAGEWAIMAEWSGPGREWLVAASGPGWLPRHHGGPKLSL